MARIRWKNAVGEWEHQYPGGMTIREAQRFAARIKMPLSNDDKRFIGQTARVLRIAILPSDRHGYASREMADAADLAFVRRTLDSLAGIFGPAIKLRDIDASSERPEPNSVEATMAMIQKKAERRPKGTDQVAPAGENPSDGQLHGGNGASQEVADGISAGGDKRSGRLSEDNAGSPVNAEDAGGAASAAGEAVNPVAAETVAQPGQGGNTSAGGVGTSEANNATPQGGCDRDAADHPQSGDALLAARGEAAADYRDSHPDDQGADRREPIVRANSDDPDEVMSGEEDAGRKWPAKLDDAELADAPAVKSAFRRLKNKGSAASATNHSFGGITASLEQARPDAALIKRVRAALTRLLQGGDAAPGPRLDAQKLCERLKTSRPLAPARREEEGRPAILVLPDVSGSCSHLSDQSCTVAKAVATIGICGADVIVVAHSNGYPMELQANNGKPQPVANLETSEDIDRFYANLLRRYNIRIVVALGDDDAQLVYRRLAEHPSATRLIWLDHWSSRRISQPIMRNDKLTKEKRWPTTIAKKTIYIIACGDGEDFATGLEMALKEIN